MISKYNAKREQPKISNLHQSPKNEILGLVGRGCQPNSEEDIGEAILSLSDFVPTLIESGSFSASEDQPPPMVKIWE